MKFSELSKGERFRLHRRGTLLTKTGPTTYSSDRMTGLEAAPDASVLPATESMPVAAPDPFGASNRVEFKRGTVSMVGTFTREQLEAVLAAMPEHR